MLQQVSRNYADMTLADMTGEPSPNLFSVRNRRCRGCSPVSVGRTGQGSHRAGGDGAARGIDWVLSDRQQDTSADISPDTCVTVSPHATLPTLPEAGWRSQQHSLEKGRLALRHSRPADLMADARQSPLIALTDTLAWQRRQAGKTVACQTRWRNRHRTV